jgi:hypothetical protein
MQTFCQIVVVVFLAIGFFASVKESFEGKKAKEPDGFHGFVITVIVSVVLWAAMYGSGALSQLIPVAAQ